MRALLKAVRFMRVVTPLPPLMGERFARVLLAGNAAIAASPGSARQSLVPVLALQMFAGVTQKAAIAPTDRTCGQRRQSGPQSGRAVLAVRA